MRVTVPVRPAKALSLFFGLAIAGLVGAWWLAFSGREARDIPASENSSIIVAVTEPAPSGTAAETSVSGTPEKTLIPVTEPDDLKLIEAGPEPSLETRAYVEDLVRASTPGSASNSDSLDRWKESFLRLVNGGASSIPAIREFLKNDIDVEFGPNEQTLLGYTSVRRALFDALSKIGGEEAIKLIRETLRNTAEPREVAVLARTLQSMAPDKYVRESLTATRETLQLAASGKLADFDVAPLFEVMQKMGGPEVARELEQAAPSWSFYSATALAQLPDGVGISSLVRMSEGGIAGEGARNVAQQMLAQLSLEYPEAREALIDQVRSGNVASGTWPYLIRLLGGERYSVKDPVFEERSQPGTSGGSAIHFSSGNQNLQIASWLKTASPEQVEMQLAFLDQLAAAARDPAAAKAVAESRKMLTFAR